MPSQNTANDIRRSLAPGEHYADFAYMFDAITFLRRPYERNPGISESIVGRILCVLVPDKPEEYVDAMQRFRLGFAGLADSSELQAEFSNSVTTAAMTVGRVEEIFWRPSLYFSLPRRLFESKRLLEKWF